MHDPDCRLPRTARPVQPVAPLPPLPPTHPTGLLYGWSDGRNFSQVLEGSAAALPNRELLLLEAVLRHALLVVRSEINGRGM